MHSNPMLGKSVLVVEDEYLIADSLCCTLETDGVQVVGPFPSVASAMQALDEGMSVDAALLDVNLKGESVYPVADRLMNRNVPIILTTGYDGEAIPSHYAYLRRLQKPIFKDDLVTCLKGVLSEDSHR